MANLISGSRLRANVHKYHPVQYNPGVSLSSNSVIREVTELTITATLNDTVRVAAGVLNGVVNVTIDETLGYLTGSTVGDVIYGVATMKVVIFSNATTVPITLTFVDPVSQNVTTASVNVTITGPIARLSLDLNSGNDLFISKTYTLTAKAYDAEGALVTASQSNAIVGTDSSIFACSTQSTQFSKGVATFSCTPRNYTDNLLVNVTVSDAPNVLASVTLYITDAASSLVIYQDDHPNGVQSSEPFSVHTTAYDRNGMVVRSISGNVTLFTNDPGSIVGQTSSKMNGGSAYFTISLIALDRNLTLSARTDSLVYGSTVVPVFGKVHVLLEMGTIVIGTSFNSKLTVYDMYNNVITKLDGGNYTLVVSDSATGLELDRSSTVTFSNGFGIVQNIVNANVSSITANATFTFGDQVYSDALQVNTIPKPIDTVNSWIGLWNVNNDTCLRTLCCCYETISIQKVNGTFVNVTGSRTGSQCVSYFEISASAVQSSASFNQKRRNFEFFNGGWKGECGRQYQWLYQIPRHPLLHQESVKDTK